MNQDEYDEYYEIGMSACRIGMMLGPFLPTLSQRIGDRYTGERNEQVKMHVWQLLAKGAMSLAAEIGDDGCECPACLCGHIEDVMFSAIKADEYDLEMATPTFDILDELKEIAGECPDLEDEIRDL